MGERSFIPLVDLKRQYQAIRHEVLPKIEEVVASGNFIGGSEVQRFEEEFAAFCGTRFAAGLASGTAALYLLLKAFGIGPGDEVVTTSHTFFATVTAILTVGAKPVLVDIAPETYNIDTTQIESVLTQKTRAIIPVHLYGQPADMDPVLEIAQKHNLTVIEDACQAHGALYKNRKAGTLGHAAAFSFYPAKNLGAYGDAGAVVTNDERIQEQVKALREHGMFRRYYHDILGDTLRLDALQAAILRLKLPHLEAWNEARRRCAQLYSKLLESLEESGLVITPKEQPWVKHVYHLYVIRVSPEMRDPLLEHLRSHNIGPQVHYPVPIHRQKAYSELGYEDMPLLRSEEIANSIISLPLFPELTESEIQAVAQCIESFFRS